MRPRLGLFPLTALLQLSQAHPAQQPSAQDSTDAAITPGAGLPSLGDLGLTAQDLLKRSVSPRPTDNLQDRDIAAAQFYPKCYNANTCTMGAAKLCQNYLNSIGSQECRVSPGKWDIMCNSTLGTQTAFVRGQADSGQQTASSPCSDVAKGLDWIFDTCSQARCAGDDCIIGGINAAWRNGNLIVELVGKDGQLSNS